MSQPQEHNSVKSLDGISRVNVRSSERGSATLKIMTWVFSLSALAIINFFVAKHIVDNRASALRMPAPVGQPQLSESLQQLAKQNALGVDASGQLVLNGQLQLNNAAVLDPSDAPVNPVAGQLYMSKTDNLIYYYSGTSFVSLLTGVPAQLATTAMSDATTTTSPAMLSLQGRAGALTLTAGGGIAINGATISNAGVKSLHVGPGLGISGSTGDVSIVLAQDISPAASPSFASLTLIAPLGIGSGGTGAISAVNARANLQAAARGANADITSISGLTTALSVGQGGTGLNAATTGGVLVGNTTGGYVVVAPTSTGQCLLADTTTTLTFGTCGSGGGGGITAGAAHNAGRFTKWSSNTGSVITDSLIGDDGTQIFGYGDLILTEPAGDSTTAFQIQNGGEMALLNADTTTMTISVVNLEISQHFLSVGTNLTVSSVLNAGDSCQIVGNDVSGKIIYASGSSPQTGDVCTFAFNHNFGVHPNIVISGNDAASAAIQPYAKAVGTTQFTIGVSRTPVPANSSFQFEYFAVGNRTTP